jgi:2'-5' RNA ligase
MPLKTGENDLMARRIFIAVVISEDIRRIVYEQSRKAFAAREQIRIIPPENIHITLKFLGDTRDEDIGRIINAVSAAVSGHKSFEYSLEDRIGAFPSTGRAKIAFIGINRGRDHISSLYESIEDKLYSLGIEKEKRSFHPHITIARIKKPSDIGSVKWEITDLKGYSPEASSVAVFESILGRRGARYIIIERFVLK